MQCRSVIDLLRQNPAVGSEEEMILNTLPSDILTLLWKKALSLIFFAKIYSLQAEC